MAGKAGSAAELIRDQALLLGALLGEAILALRGDPEPETIARAEKVSRVVKLAADAGKAVVAMEAAADKALTAGEAPAPNGSPGPAETDTDETDMDDPDAPIYTVDQVERMRDQLERRIAEILGGDESKSAPPGVRTSGPGGDPGAPLRPRGTAGAEPA